MTDQNETYRVSVQYREGRNWHDLKGSPIEECSYFLGAIFRARRCDLKDRPQGEYRALVKDSEGGWVSSHEWKIDRNQDILDSATWIVKVEEEDSIIYYGISEGKYLHTIQNRFSRLAPFGQKWARTRTEMADEVEEISLVRLIKGIIEHNGGDTLEAMKKIAADHPTKSVDDFIIELEQESKWSEDDTLTVAGWLQEDEDEDASISL